MADEDTLYEEGDPQDVTGSTAPQAFSADDVASWGQPTEQHAYQPEDVADWGAPEEVHASEWGSFARRAVREAPIGAVAGAAGVLAAAPGAAAGALTSPVTGPVGPVVGGLATGVPAAMGTSSLLHKGEDWVLEKLGLKEGTGFFSSAQEVADRMENPKSAFAGDLAGNTLPAFGTGIGKGGAMVGQRVLGGGLQAGMEAGQEAYRGESLDPAKLGMSAAAGALFAKPRAWVDAITPGGGGNSSSGPRAPGSPEPEPGLGGPTRDFKGDTPLNGEVLPADPYAITYDNTGKWARDIESAIAQRDGFDRTDPMWQFWHDYIGQLQAREDGKGGVDVDASLGPVSDEHPFTYEMANRANDATPVAVGVAHENPPAPQVEGAGNPVGAPMEARVAQRPSGLLRDYRKEASPEGTGLVTQESTRISQAPIHEDIAAALTSEQPKVSHDQAPAPVEGRPATPAPSEPPAPRPHAPGEPVTEAVTPLAPHVQRVLDTARQQLQEAGMQRVLEKLDALPPKQAAQAATQLLQALGSKTGEATGAGSPGEIRMPSKRPEIASGMTARSKADAARKQGVLDAYDQAAQKFGRGPEGEEQGALLDRLKNLVTTADKLSGGAAYRPNVKPPSWTLIKAARAALAKPTPKNIEAYRQAEAMTSGKDEGKNLEQETARIDSDIEKRPQISDAAAEALVNQNAPDKGRPDHETFSNNKGEESAIYTGEHNALTNWLNGLGDGSHALLMKEHPDIELDVKTTQDPRALMDKYMSDLAEAQRKAATFEAAPAENMPVAKRTAIRTRDDLAPTEPGTAASAGRALDRNSPEFKRLAAQYGTGEAPTKAKYDLEHEEAQLKPVDGTAKSAVDHFMDLMADESGAARTTDLYDWMKQKATDFFSPAAADPIKEYGKALGFGFTRLSNRLTQFKSGVLANARAAQFADGTKPNAAEKGRIYRAWERGETGLLPGKLKDYYEEFVKPLEQKYGPMYDEYRQMAIALGVVPFEELPVRKNNGNGFMQWVPRIQKGKHAWDAANDDNVDPVSGQTLSHWAETTQMRDWFSLQNTNGDRFTYIPGDGFITRMTNGAPGRIKVSSNFDPTEIGATIKLKRGGKEDTWTVDHATIDEITRAGGKNTDGTPKLQYHDSPVIAMTNAIYGLNNALERLRLYRDVINSPEFQANSTRSKKEASENGWIESKLPQFDGKYMPEPWAWTMDDFFKSGFDFGNGSVGKTWGALQRFTGATAKLFYFFGPLVHGLNEMDKWAIGRGYNWVTPGGWKSLVVDGNTALKSVWRQDAVQREMTEAGANPMLAHTLTRNLMQKVARSTGDNIAANPSKWDPFARAFGVSTKELASSAYEKSSALMWWMSDVMLTQRYLEEKRLRGLSPKEAAASAHDFIDSYKVPPTIADGALGKGGGRLARQFVTDPATSLFGPYHYGVFHTFGNMTSKLLGPQATKQERVRAAGQWAVAAAMMYAVYPLLSAGYAKLTGNDKSEVERRGLSRLMGTAGELAEGKKGVVDMLRNLWTPSTIADTAIREVQGKDWRGKDIVDPQDFTDEPVKKTARAVGQQGEFLAGQMVAPYKQLMGGVKEPGATPGSVAWKFVEQNSGLKTPSAGAERFEAQRDKRQHAIAKGRAKRPNGMIEELMNRITE